MSNYVAVPHGTINVGEWNQFTVVRNGYAVTFYKNGVQLGTTQTLPFYNDNFNSTIFFGSDGDGSFASNVKMDEVRIYTAALTSQQASDLYNSGQATLRK